MKRPGGASAKTIALIVTLMSASSVSAQIVPNDHWRTIETRHFRIHFTPPLEAMARRAAPRAEHAFEMLSRELVAPGGKVDLVIADNVDYTNGYATPFPSNRIVVYAHPPVDEVSLRNYADWSELVVTHELTHIFHLSRSEGWWKVGRYVFGRHPLFFPNAFLPSWVTEGLAVYYESRLTGTGRLEGSEHYMIAHAAAEAGRFPGLNEISEATSRFPGGEVVYAYGSLIFDYLSQTHGPQSIPRFIDVTSRSIFPITLNGKAKKAFGLSFERAWKNYTDSIIRTTQRNPEPIRGWRQLTSEGWFVKPPRWLGDTILLYGASTGREVSQAYEVTLSGSERKLGRRNAPAVNVPLPNGDILFSQPDFVDPFHYRNDLYVQRGRRQIRLTHGARVSSPDVRANGDIVAVQNVPGSTRLVRITPDGKRISPITRGALDEQWLEPRWSPDGNRIAAVRLPSGNRAEIVVIDTLGSVMFSRVFAGAVPGSPSWSPDGRRIFFSSDHSGSMQIYSIDLPQGGSERLSNAVTGVFDPESSPSARWIAATLYKADGYHLGVAPLSADMPPIRDTVLLGEREACTTCRVHDPRPYLLSDDPNIVARKYSPWHSLLPTYWEPVIESEVGAGTKFGAATSGEDVIGIHSYAAQATYGTKFKEAEGFLAYRYSGFGQPYLNMSAEQTWDHGDISRTSDSVVIGDLAERARIYAASLTFSRPRVRTSASFSVGGEIETRDYSTDPDSLLRLLSPFFSEAAWYPSVVASAAWTNTRRPPLSISREDGITLAATARERWRKTSGESAFSSAPSHTLIGVINGYKSLDLPGFAHHVVAVRGAAGYTDGRTISLLSAGGLSGSSLDVIAGYGIGGERRTFGVRGFPPSAERGIRAFAGTLEYRAPIAAPSRHIRFIPLLFDRISATAFGDAGRAFCPASSVNSSTLCSANDVDNPWLASVGAELNLDAALYYDIPARIRLGFAVPVAGRDATRAKSASGYLTFGTSF
ncbi:MAG TPA: hypothetical protein VNC11_10630 [Gemmatimonadaceae bacterium]|nr:hypothetical protein [Gemmatimonadaceae bacterium]